MRAGVPGALFFLLALGAASAYAVLDRGALFWDEYYQLLAARSWAAEGTLGVGDGAYTRAAWLSISVGWLFRTFGESILIARIGAAAVTAVWTLVLFLWLRREAGRGAAWIAGLMFAFSPIVLVNAVMVRFYAVTGLLLLLAVVATHRSFERARSPTRALIFGPGAVLCALIAYRITPLTRLWIVGLGVWAVGSVLLKLERSGRRSWALATAGTLAVAALLAAVPTGWLEGVWTVYRDAPVWSADRSGDVRWYERMLRRDYPLLWGLFPAATLMALLRSPRLAGLCLSVFGIGFLLLSGAGPKAERYALPLLPFFFALWGVALAQALPLLRAWVSGAAEHLVPVTPRALRRLAPPLLLTGIVGFALIVNPGFVRLRDLRTGHLASLDRDPVGSSTSPSRWDELAPLVRPVMSEVDAVVTANSLQMLYHVGNYDYEMRPTVIPELQPPEEFGMDMRTGRPAISTLDSLLRVIQESPIGLVLGERRRWGHPFEGFTPDVEAFIYANMEEVVLPARFGIRAYRWGSRVPEG